MRTSHYLLLLFVFLTSISALIGASLITETFNVSSPPTNWYIYGETAGSHTSAGTPKVNASLFPLEGGNRYLRLTENSGYNRAWAYYTAGTFAMKGNWKLNAQIRIGKFHNNADNSGADGLSFTFLDKATFANFGNSFTQSQVEGGFGEWLGAPRAAPAGTTSSAMPTSLGRHDDVKGFSFEFDHYTNTMETFSEYVHWVSLTNWAHVGNGKDMSATVDSYYDNGWKDIELESVAGVINFRYRTNAVGNPWSAPHLIYTVGTDFQAYLGICSATGGASAYHEVRNVTLDSDDITLPLQMSSFSAVPNSNNTATLQWVTYAETNLSGYSLYRGTNPVFNEATNLNVFIEAANSSQPVTYQYIDSDISTSGSYYYWVQSNDLDGTVNLFGPAYVQIQSNTPTTPSLPTSQGIINVYPNPFGPTTTIKFGISKASNTSLQIFNTRGQIVRSLRQQQYQAGEYSLIWDGKDDSGRDCSNGIYTLRMISGSDASSRRLVIIK